MCGRPVIVDVFDAEALTQRPWARPDVVIHQLTDLPDVNDPAEIRRNARGECAHPHRGHAQPDAAARAAGVRRVIAQSVAFAYAPGA